MWARPKLLQMIRRQFSFDRVGSVKANIGHTEGCSFLASLIKVSLMLNRKEIIPNIRYQKPNPKINVSNWEIMKVQTQVWTRIFVTNCQLSNRNISFSWNPSHQTWRPRTENGSRQYRLTVLVELTPMLSLKALNQYLALSSLQTRR